MVEASIIATLIQDLTQPATQFCVFLIVALTVNLEFGYTGIPNFGKVLFVAVGAFVAGSLGYRLMIYVLDLHAADIFAQQAGWVPLIDSKLVGNPLMAVGLAAFMLAVGAIFGGVVGYLSSYPAIRIREDYLGMLLLASGEFFNTFSQAYYPFLGGAQGMTAPSPIFDLGTPGKVQNLLVLSVLVVAAVLVYVYSERVGRSPLGRTLRAVRDNEVASEALGKDNVAIRRKVLVVGSMVSGIAGVLFLFYQPYIEPGTIGSFTRQTFTFIPFVIVILGGMANNRGVLLGTFVYMLITTAFSQGTTILLAQGITLPIDLNRVQQLLVGSLVIIVLLYRPQGLVPEKPTSTMPKGRLRELREWALSKPGEQSKGKSNG